MLYSMLKAIRILVDVMRQLAYVQMESPEGEVTYEIDARGGDVFKRVHDAVAATNHAITRRRNSTVETDILREVAKML
jgi:hypothetical protein